MLCGCCCYLLVASLINGSRGLFGAPSKAATVEQELIKSRWKALSSSRSPHFIFTHINTASSAVLCSRCLQNRVIIIMGKAGVKGRSRSSNSISSVRQTAVDCAWVVLLLPLTRLCFLLLLSSGIDRISRSSTCSPFAWGYNCFTVLSSLCCACNCH